MGHAKAFKAKSQTFQVLHQSKCMVYTQTSQVLSSSWDGRPFCHNRHGPKIWGLCPFWGELVPHVTQCAWAKAYLYTKWHFDPSSCLSTINMDWKVGLCPFLGKELGPHLTQCGLGRGLPPCQVSSWSIQPLAAIDMGRKFGGLCPPFGEGSWVPI